MILVGVIFLCVVAVAVILFVFKDWVGIVHDVYKISHIPLLMSCQKNCNVYFFDFLYMFSPVSDVCEHIYVIIYVF